MKKTLDYYMQLSYPITLVQREHGGYFATHPDLSGCMADGATAEEAVRNLRDSREMWIEAKLEGGYDVPEPVGEDYSGRLSLRMSARLHAGVAEVASREGISLNQLINNVLFEYLGGARVARAFLEELRDFHASAAREAQPVRVFRVIKVVSGVSQPPQSAEHLEVQGRRVELTVKPPTASETTLAEEWTN